MTTLQAQLQQAFPSIKWQFDKLLAPLTYFKIGGPAEVYWACADLTTLPDIVRYCRENAIKITMLGGASNVLVADEGVAGLTIHITASTVTRNPNPDFKTEVMAEAGCKTALLVSQTIQLGLGGLEHFLGVPGTVGGAIYNNAHYLSHLIAEHITAVEIINAQNEFEWLPVADCDFGYDTSRFQKTQEIITRVKFVLEPGDLAKSQALVKTATQYRARTQPLGEPSSGCIFQNTPNNPQLQKLFPDMADTQFVPGGFLIDQAGLKGSRVGEIEVSHKHAAFFINKGHGTAQDVLDLIAKVKATVKAKFDVTLQEEVFFLR